VYACVDDGFLHAGPSSRSKLPWLLFAVQPAGMPFSNTSTKGLGLEPPEYKHDGRHFFYSDHYRTMYAIGCAIHYGSPNSTFNGSITSTATAIDT
jgi:hypothetical protein